MRVSIILAIAFALVVGGCSESPKDIERRTYEESAARLKGEERAQKEAQLRKMEEILSSLDRQMGSIPRNQAYEDARAEMVREMEILRKDLAKP